MPAADVARAAPVSDEERLRIVDLLRGAALLGILLMNIDGFAQPAYFTEPFRADPSSLDFWASLLNRVFFEGKMRALFGMVFGAGVFLFVAGKARTGRPARALFYRRMAWLVLFGVVHAWLLLWFGDILYLYGIAGMIVYLLRNVPPRYLVLGVPLVALLDFGTGTLFYRGIREKRIAYVAAQRAEAEHRPPTEAEAKAVAAWREVEKTLVPSRADVAENTRKMRGGYAEVATVVRPLARQFETTLALVGLPDSLALMLLGIALLRMGFLRGDWPARRYAWVAAAGYGLGIPLAAYERYDAVLHHPTLEASLAYLVVTPVEWVNLIYPFQRILLVLAHVSVLVLLHRSGALAGLLRRLRCVGQMALTNYVLHTVACALFFYGYGLGMYGRLAYRETFLVVLAIWAFQLVASPWWLSRFRFGPLEWLWRTLTYLRVQPMRRPASVLPAAPA
ncbi:MAG TPA: DUF418 domain-containing protein [Anaeromyxobacter sp.]